MSKNKNIVFYRTKKGKICWFDPVEYKRKKEEMNRTPEKGEPGKSYTCSIKNRYLNKAKPGQGSIHIEDGVDKNGPEANGARWYWRKIGGKITVLKPKGIHGQDDPDLDIDTKHWDWKDNEENTEGAIDHLVRKGLEQIRIEDRPGGVILNIKKNGVKKNETVIKGVDKRLARSARPGTVVIIKRGDKIVDIRAKQKKKK